MYVKKLKRRCSVRGCKNTDTFAISRTREIGNSVIMCKSCLYDALASIKDIKPETKDNIPAKNSLAPALFFNDEAIGKENAVNMPVSDNNNPEQTNNDEIKADAPVEEQPIPLASEFVCPNCGRAFDSEKGLNTHLRYCKDQPDKD